MGQPLYFCGAAVTNEQLALIGEIVHRHGGLSRTELANTLCERLDWVRPNGKLKTGECRQFLEQLDERNVIQLPVRDRRGRKKGKSAPNELTSSSACNTPLEGTVGAFQPVTLRRVSGVDDRRLWRELVERHHYLGYCIPFGAHLCYFIEVSKSVSTLVGCIQLSSPAWRMAARDRCIGWDDALRARQDRDHERHGSAPKTLFVYPLHRHAVACLKNERPDRVHS